MIYTTTKKCLKKEQRCLFEAASCIGLICLKKERKQDCTHVDHNKLGNPLLFKIIYANILCFVDAQALHYI